MFLSHLKTPLLRVSTKLTLAYSLVLIFSCVLIFSALYFKVHDIFNSEEQVLLSAKLEEYRNFINIRGQKDFETYFNSLSNYRGNDDLLLMRISARGEDIFVHEPKSSWRPDIERIKSEAFNQNTIDFNFKFAAPENPELAIAVGTILTDGTILLVARSVESFLGPLVYLRKIFWWMLLPVSLIGFLGGLVLSNRTLSPVRELIISMKKIESGSLSTRVPIRGSDDELEELKILSNRMLDKIENLVSSLKEAFDHLAHDIRTPVTRLRGRAEIALNNKEGDIDSYREALQSCYENSDKILTFLQVLTDITEAENRSRKLKLKKKYISDFVRGMMNLYEIAFEEKEIAVIQKLDTNDWAMVDSRLIKRVIANLLDNAYKYSSGGGEVTIETINQTESVILRVTDTGPGIAPEEHALIWQKLYRSDKSRSEYGMGLGLTFVKAIVEAHDGKVSVRSPVKDGRGTQFEILLQKMS